jgi:hypothetical protein
MTELPIKGRVIIAHCSDGKKRTIFRCNCWNQNCKEWRCAVTGYALMITVISWEYDVN